MVFVMTNLEKLIEAKACQNGIDYYKARQNRFDEFIKQDDIIVNEWKEFDYLIWAINNKLIKPKSIKYEGFDNHWNKYSYDKNGKEIKFEYK